MFKSINPATGATVARFDGHTPTQVNNMLIRAVHAQDAWKRKPVAERVGLLTSLATVLRQEKANYAALITLEMGKPIVEAEAEIEKCAWTCDFYAAHAEKFLSDEEVDTTATLSKIVFDPLGLVLAVMPWNYPFWQFIRFAAPAIAAGNGTVLKHASNVPQCALAIEALFRAAGAPDGLCTVLLAPAASVNSLIEDVRIAAVTLTGSTEVGKIVAAQAGAQMKKQVLELGGSDPFIVLADADIDAAAQAAVTARFGNTGQSCISAKRFIVVDEVADRFVAAFCKLAAQLRVGAPGERDTQVGPMARANLRTILHEQTERTLAAGARLVLGGKEIDGPGFFYAPTILDHVTDQMAAGTEETFGPLAAVMRVRCVDDAIRLANATEFGLGAALWTGDMERAAELARRIDAGAVFINGLVASDARLPFGGIKQSGYGRELGVHGIREFVNIKTVWTGPRRQAA
jgi:succinate-semialdehyde dehydrogenase/glutarate-semialdehyde dehydrogenase